MTRSPIRQTGMNTNIEAAGDAGVFSSLPVLRGTFESRLLDLVREDSLGVFILVLANASFESASFERLRPSLASVFQAWCDRFDSGDRRAGNAPADDVAVFQRLRRLGFDRLAATRWRQIDPWELQFNPMRALRPPRMSHVAVDNLCRPFDPHGFHFNQSFLRPEVFWEGKLAGAPARLLYNKFPFAGLHGLLVPHPSACKSQLLTQEEHSWAWDLVRELGRHLPGLGFGYNAYGAYASVNHLHFQLFVRATGHYPVESHRWRHNGGSQDYPLAVSRLDSCETAWRVLQRLHAAGHTYNLLYRPGELYLFERAMQGSYRHRIWTAGFAWSELAGSVTTSDSEAFARLSAQDVEDELGRLAIRP